MADNNFMDKLRTFFGIRQDTPTNEFRNPIWGSDDEDDGDELYTRQNIDMFTNTNSLDLHQEFARQMQDIIRSFGSVFGEISMTPPQPSEEHNYSGSIRDYYLKPGYHNRTQDQPKEDMDLDGKITSNELSGLLKQNEEENNITAPVPFNGNLVPGTSFCQTIITTSVKKADGTVETRKIVKNGNEVVEEITTTTAPDFRPPFNSNNDQAGPMGDTGLIYNNVLTELSSLFRNFY